MTPRVTRKIRPNSYALIGPDKTQAPRRPPGPAIYNPPAVPVPVPPAPPALRFIYLPSDALTGVTLTVVAWCNDGARMLVTDYYTNVYASTDGYNWTQIGTIGTGGDVLAMAYGGGAYVAVGPGGVAYTSTDAVTWTPGGTGVGSDHTCIVFGNGLFVAASAADGTTVASSDSGASWSPGNTGLGTFGRNLAYGNSMFLGIAGANVVYSSDGLSWGVEAVVGTYFCAAYSPSLDLFSVRGAGGASATVQLGPVVVNESFPLVGSSQNGVDWGSGVFASCDTNGYVYTSTDGGNYVLAGQDPNPSNNYEQDILAGLSGIFLVKESSPPT